MHRGKDRKFPRSPVRTSLRLGFPAISFVRCRGRRANVWPMPREIYFITHPDVVIDPRVPVPQWPLSARGRERMQRVHEHEWVRGIRSVHCSTEQKAIDGAQILAGPLGLSVQQHDALGENDRSATGYLPKAEFEATADAFFAHPHESIRGWERAIDAQARIVGGVERVVATAAGAGSIAIVSHGGVGGLLLCHVKRCAISRTEDQPGGAGGNYFVFRLPGFELVQGWQPIDAPRGK